jgi:succinate dehydrogenase / fumarate reductase iron-sulfur subunit
MSPNSERTENRSQNASGEPALQDAGHRSGIDARTYRFEIFRSPAAPEGEGRFQVYQLAVDRPMSVLEALLKIQDQQDPSLAFRYCCRGAICGSCAMSINGRLNLACRVQLAAIPARRVVLEPLPGFEIVRDLVVDMDQFWAKYERTQPWLHADAAPAQERRMSEPQRARIDGLVNCILCGLCSASCPVSRSDPAFSGPAALAKLYRFWADARESRAEETIRQEDHAAGMWGCHTIMNCTRVCPKEVRPSDGIRGLRRASLGQRLKKVFGGQAREA